MARRLFTLLSALSLLLCVAVGVLWVQSYRYGVGVARRQQVAARQWARADIVGVDSGRFIHRTIDTTHSVFGRGDAPPYWYGMDGRTNEDRGMFDLTHSFSSRAVRGGGFAWESGRFVPPIVGWYRLLVVPCWFPALLFSLLPAVWIRGAYRRRRRPPPGCCPSCGYDLRATPGRCPECGAAATPSDRRWSAGGSNV